MTYAPVRALKVIWRAYTAKKKKVEALSLFAMAAELFELYKPPQTKLDLLIRGPVIRGVAARVVAWEQPGKYSRMHRAGAAAVIKLNRWMDGFAARSGAELVGVLLRIMPTSSSASFSARTANSNGCRQGLHIDSYPNSKALAACAAGAAPPTMYRTIISFIPNSSEKSLFCVRSTWYHHHHYVNWSCFYTASWSIRCAMEDYRHTGHTFSMWLMKALSKNFPQ